MKFPLFTLSSSKDALLFRWRRQPAPPTFPQLRAPPSFPFFRALMTVPPTLVLACVVLQTLSAPLLTSGHLLPRSVLSRPFEPLPLLSRSHLSRSPVSRPPVSRHVTSLLVSRPRSELPPIRPSLTSSFFDGSVTTVDGYWASSRLISCYVCDTDDPCSTNTTVPNIPIQGCQDPCFISIAINDNSSHYDHTALVRRGCSTGLPIEISRPRQCLRKGDLIWCFCVDNLCNGRSIFEVLAESNECGPINPCRNGGICTDGVAEYECTCPQGFYGTDCESFDGCVTSPCMNAATCVNLDTMEFVCECSPGFVGQFCEIEVNECTSSPCKNFATCIDHVNGYVCMCTNDFTGRHCETPEDACTSSPCSNGGTCKSIKAGGESGYVCECVTGYGGNRCRDVTDFCVFELCRNGGSCRGFGGANYICECLAGFMGRNCEVSLVDPCRPNPCDNGGTCIHSPGGLFECACTSLWTGSRCESGIDSAPPDPCRPNPCLNNGKCIQDGAAFECNCLHGYTGMRCDVRDACVPNPCVNGGTCLRAGDGSDVTRFECACLDGFAGRACEEVLSVCNPNPCQNQGACMPDMTKPGRLSCTCLPGYTGPLCEVLIPICEPNPCQNAGNCQEKGEGRFKCRCQIGFQGPTCGIQPSPCVPNPCLNGGKCVDKGETRLECICPRGFAGARCEVLAPEACSTLPCLNGGTCKSLPFNAFKCACAPAFTGKTCSSKLGCKDGHKCLNGATCVDNGGGGGYTCQCQMNFQGEFCQIPIVDSFSCGLKADGLYSVPRDPCTPVYYVCSMGKTFEMACPAETVFNPSNSICDWPYRMNCKKNDFGNFEFTNEILGFPAYFGH